MLVDRGLGFGRAMFQGLLAGVDPIQEVPAGVSAGHAGRHDREVPVSRRAITSVIAQ